MSQQTWIVVAAVVVLLLVGAFFFVPTNEPIPADAPPTAAEREMGPAGVTANEPGPDTPGLPAADPQATDN